MGQVDDRRRDTRLRVVLTVASVLVAGSNLMPWATFDTVPTTTTTVVRPGTFGLVLVVLAIGVIGAAWISPGRLSRSRRHVSILSGGAVLAVSIVLALRAISKANSLPSAGPSATSYACGAAIAIASSLAVLVVSVLR